VVIESQRIARRSPLVERRSADPVLTRDLRHGHAGFGFLQNFRDLRPPDYAFGYKFTSGGHPHEHLIHDWEVQAAYIAYRRRYSDHALDMLQQEYCERIPTHNLHFILGTMKAHPQTFIIIGLLRSPVSPDDLDKQPELF
jgi:hypothetical protein